MYQTLQCLKAMLSVTSQGDKGVLTPVKAIATELPIHDPRNPSPLNKVAPLEAEVRSSAGDPRRRSSRLDPPSSHGWTLLGDAPNQDIVPPPTGSFQGSLTPLATDELSRIAPENSIKTGAHSRLGASTLAHNLPSPLQYHIEMSTFDYFTFPSPPLRSPSSSSASSTSSIYSRSSEDVFDRLVTQTVGTLWCHRP